MEQDSQEETLKPDEQDKQGKKHVVLQIDDVHQEIKLERGGKKNG